MKHLSVCCVICMMMLSFPANLLAQDLDLEFSMPSHYFIPGNQCSLDLEIENIGIAYSNVAAFVALDVGVGHYWFSPTWREYPGGVDYHTFNIAAGESMNLTILPNFVWPEGVGTFLGASFIAAVTSVQGNLISDIDIYPFGWMEGPSITEVIPANAAPGTSFWVYGVGLGGDSKDIYAEIGGMPVPALSLEHYDSGIDVASFVVPIVDPGSYNLILTVAEKTSNPIPFTVAPLPSTGLPHGAVVDGMQIGFDNAIAIFKTDILEGAIARGEIPVSRRQEYVDNFDRASMIFTAFSNEWGNMTLEEQELFEKMLVSAGIYELFDDLEKTTAAFAGADHASDMAFYMMIDATSACLTGIDIAWTGIDIAAAVAALASGGIGLALPAVAGGIQLGIKIADKALDGFVTSDLDSFGIQDGSMGDQYVEVEKDKSETWILHGQFKAQMTWQKASFTAVIDIMMFGLFEKLPFSDAAKDQAMKSILNFVAGILNNIGISLTEDILTLTGPPDQTVVTIDYTVMEQMGIQQALATTAFGGGILNGPIGLYLYLAEIYPGYTVDDTSIAEVTFSGENITIKGKKTGITQLMIRGVRFVPTNFLWIFSPEIFSTVETRFNIEVKGEEEEVYLYADGMIGCEGREAALFFSGVPLVLSTQNNYSFTGYGAGTDYNGTPIYFIITGNFYLSPLSATVDVAMYGDPGYATHIRTDRANAYPVYEDWFYDSACTLIADTSAGCVPIWLGIRFAMEKKTTQDREILYFTFDPKPRTGILQDCTLAD